VSGTDSASGISWNFLFYWLQQLLSGVSFYFIDPACHAILQLYFTDTFVNIFLVEYKMQKIRKK